MWMPILRTALILKVRIDFVWEESTNQGKYFMILRVEIEDAPMGTEVISFGSSRKLLYTPDDMAHDIGTIGYEVVCSISKRVPRVYI